MFAGISVQYIAPLKSGWIEHIVPLWGGSENRGARIMANGSAGWSRHRRIIIRKLVTKRSEKEVCRQNSKSEKHVQMLCLV